MPCPWRGGWSVRWDAWNGWVMAPFSSESKVKNIIHFSWIFWGFFGIFQIIFGCIWTTDPHGFWIMGRVWETVRVFQSIFPTDGSWISPFCVHISVDLCISMYFHGYRWRLVCIGVSSKWSESMSKFKHKWKYKRTYTNKYKYEYKEKGRHRCKYKCKCKDSCKKECTFMHTEIVYLCIKCIWICIHMYAYACPCIRYVNVCANVYAYACEFISMWPSACICICMHMYTCLNV